MEFAFFRLLDFLSNDDNLIVDFNCNNGQRTTETTTTNIDASTFVVVVVVVVVVVACKVSKLF